MQAALLRAPWQFRLDEVAIPAVRPGWVRVRVSQCGICGTDLTIASRTDHQLTRFPPGQWQGFGHEVVGVIDEVWPDDTGLAPGRRVVVQSGSYCGQCRACQDGRVDLCTAEASYWVNPTLGMAQYLLAPARACVPCDSVSDDVAMLVEPCGVAMDMALTADIQLGHTVLVFGLGPIGLLSIAIARRMGARRIVAVNRSGGRRAELASRLGADQVHIGDLADAPVPEGGFDRALVSVAPVAINQVFGLMAHAGIISYIGIAYGDAGLITVPANDFHFRKLQLRASHAAPALFFPTVIDLLAGLDVEALVTDHFPLSQVREAMDHARSARGDVIKVAVRCN